MRRHGGLPAYWHIVRTFELGESQLDWVQVRAVGRQAEQRRAACLDRLAHAGDLVGAEVVQHHHVAGCQCRNEELLDVGKPEVLF